MEHESWIHRKKKGYLRNKNLDKRDQIATSVY